MQWGGWGVWLVAVGLRRPQYLSFLLAFGGFLCRSQESLLGGLPEDLFDVICLVDSIREIGIVCEGCLELLWSAGFGLVVCVDLWIWR